MTAALPQDNSKSKRSIHTQLCFRVIKLGIQVVELLIGDRGFLGCRRCSSHCIRRNREGACWMSTRWYISRGWRPNWQGEDVLFTGVTLPTNFEGLVRSSLRIPWGKGPVR